MPLLCARLVFLPSPSPLSLFPCHTHDRSFFTGANFKLARGVIKLLEDVKQPIPEELRRLETMGPVGACLAFPCVCVLLVAFALLLLSSFDSTLVPCLLRLCDRTGAGGGGGGRFGGGGGGGGRFGGGGGGGGGRW